MSREPTSYDQLKRDANNVARFGGRIAWWALCFVLIACGSVVADHIFHAIF